MRRRRQALPHSIMRYLKNQFAGAGAGVEAGAGAGIVVSAGVGLMLERFTGVLMVKEARMLITQMKTARLHVAFSMKSVVLR